MSLSILTNRGWTDSNGTFAANTVYSLPNAVSNVYVQQGRAQFTDAPPSNFAMAGDPSATNAPVFGQTSGIWGVETFNTTQRLDATKPFATLTLTASITSLSLVDNAGSAQVLYREFIQGGAGNFTVSFNTAVFEKSGASFPVLTTTAGAKDVLTFTRSSNGKWLVTAVLNVS